MLLPRNKLLNGKVFYKLDAWDFFEKECNLFYELLFLKNTIKFNVLKMRNLKSINADSFLFMVWIVSFIKKHSLNLFMKSFLLD